MATSSSASDAARDWQATRAMADIQFAPLPPTPPPEPPAWLRRLSEWLGDLLGHTGGASGFDWPLVWQGLYLLAGLLALILLWRIGRPWLARLLARLRASSANDQSGAWQPDRAEAEALLEDADRLAGEGRYDEATHLLLRRSLGQIAGARPGLLHPSSTAREIARQPGLPAAVRQPFAVIAERVERSRFALRALGAEDWQAARQAYADFALARLDARIAG